MCHIIFLHGVAASGLSDNYWHGCQPSEHAQAARCPENLRITAHAAASHEFSPCGSTCILGYLAKLPNTRANKDYSNRPMCSVADASIIFAVHAKKEPKHASVSL